MVCFPKVVQKQGLGEVETKTYLIASYVWNISAKYYYNLLSLFKVRSIMLGMFFRFSVYFNTYFAWSAFPR